MKTDFYRTKDLSEAGVLITLGKKLLEINRQGKICWFIFEDERGCKKISTNFWFGVCMVNAKYYYQAMTTLKNRIFSGG